MRTTPQRLDEPLRWLRANKHDLAPLTGTDTRALLAIAACWRLYFLADHPEHVLFAVGRLLRCMQPKCWALAKALIPWVADWSDEEQTWTRLVEGDPALMRDFFNDDHAPFRSGRDFLQCRSTNDDGSPCRRNVDGLSADFCVEHAAAAEAKVQS